MNFINGFERGVHYFLGGSYSIINDYYLGVFSGFLTAMSLVICLSLILFVLIFE